MGQTESHDFGKPETLDLNSERETAEALLRKYFDQLDNLKTRVHLAEFDNENLRSQLQVAGRTYSELVTKKKELENNNEKLRNTNETLKRDQIRVTDQLVRNSRNAKQNETLLIDLNEAQEIIKGLRKDKLAETSTVTLLSRRNIGVTIYSLC